MTALTDAHHVTKTEKGSKYFGIEWVPWKEPLKRRLETLAAFYCVFIFLLGGAAGSGFLLFLFFSPFCWAALLYLAWMWCDRHTPYRGGRRWKWARKSPNVRLLRDYFPLSLVKTADLDPSQKYIIGYHPHGVIGFGSLSLSSDATGFDEKFPGIRPYILTLQVLYWFPFIREWFLAAGAVNCSKESIEHIFRENGTTAVLLIGGAKESLDMNPHKYSLVLKNRKGFVRMALKHGAHLVPCFGFGQKDAYTALIPNEPGSLVRRFQECMRSLLTYPPILINGRGLFYYSIGLLPRRTPITTVVGRPIDVEKDEDPSEEKVTALHERYMLELRRLFEDNKVKYGDADKTLEFVD